MQSLRYHEQIQRGSPDFPLDYHFVDHNHSRYEMPYHWHEEVEIVHVLKGCFQLHLGGVTLSLTAGESAYIASGLLHGGTPEDCEYECVVFDMRLLLKSNDLCKRYIREWLDGYVAVTERLAADSQLTEHVLLPMFEALRTRCEGYPLLTLGCLYRFVGEVYRQHAFVLRDPAESGDNTRMLRLKKVFEIIENHYAEPLTLARLAASVGLTPKYLCRFFKDATHRTPMDYLAYYRVEMACYAFAATSQNVTEIALDAGFSDLNYFIRCFRKYKGVTPGRYRKTLHALPRAGESRKR